MDIFQNAENLLNEVFEEKFHKAVPEISVYLVEGVGNSTRIDYGTGAWLSFLLYSMQFGYCHVIIEKCD